MLSFIKNKRLYLLFSVLVLSFSFFLAISIRAQTTCADICSNISDSSNCYNSCAGCSWDIPLDKCCIKLEIDWPRSPGNTVVTGCSGMTVAVKYFYEWAMALGILATFISFTFGGFMYLTSTGDPAKIKEAKDLIFSSLSGLALLFSSLLILNTINPDLTKLEIPQMEDFNLDLTYIADSMQDPTRKCESVFLFEDADCGSAATSRCGDYCSPQGPSHELNDGTAWVVHAPNHYMPRSIDKYREVLNCSESSTVTDDGGLCVLHVYNGTCTCSDSNYGCSDCPSTETCSCTTGEHAAYFLPQKDLLEFLGDSSEGDDTEGDEINWNEVTWLQVTSSIRD